MTRKEEILNKSIEVVDKNLEMWGIKDSHEFSVVACQDVAEWADKTMIEKACVWLKENGDKYTWYDEMCGDSGLTDEFIVEFKKAMLEE